MSDLTLVALLAAVVLLACLVGGMIAIGAVLAGRPRRHQGLGEEDVASILGYPMWPVHTPHAPRNGSDRDDEATPA